MQASSQLLPGAHRGMRELQNRPREAPGPAPGGSRRQHANPASRAADSPSPEVFFLPPAALVQGQASAPGGLLQDSGLWGAPHPPGCKTIQIHLLEPCVSDSAFPTHRTVNTRICYVGISGCREPSVSPSFLSNGMISLTGKRKGQWE